jgi:hypothetical protein
MMPRAYAHVWGWFCELDLQRHYDFNGSALPLSNVEIGSWAQLRGTRLLPWEFRLLRQLDAVAINVSRSKSDGS